MAGVKNNLADIHKRTKDLSRPAPPSLHISHSSDNPRTKFKPPNKVIPVPSDSVRQPQTGVLSFSTSGFGRSIRDCVVIPTPDTSISGISSSSSLLPSKRPSDLSATSASSAVPVKRTKLKHSNDKENVLDAAVSLSQPSSTSVPSRLPQRNVDIVDIEDDLHPPARSLASQLLSDDTPEQLTKRLQENRRVRNFFEDLLSGDLQEEGFFRNDLNRCLDRIREIEKEQESRRRHQQSLNPQRTGSFEPCPIQTPITPARSQAALVPPIDEEIITVSNTDDEDDDVWNSFSDLPEIDDVDIGGPSAAASSVALDSLYVKEALRVLNQVFSLPSFRHHQLEAIDATMAGRDVFVLMPTGGGKSICYQVPAVCTGGKTKGVTFVISPLIALMTDQVNTLNKMGVDAVQITSQTGSQQFKDIRERLLGKGRKPAMVYVAPERFQSNETLTNWMRMLHSQGQLARFVIDEAHCISTWGRDFREAYKDLGCLRQNFPSVPIMALTATANDQVQGDVIARLGLKDCVRLRQSFNRKNLYYEVRAKTPAKTLISEIAAWIQNKHKGHTGIIYARTKVECENLAQELRENYSMSADFYHADMDSETKNQKLSNWQNGVTKIVVATIAFGMGIDKANVRFVIHHTLPQTFDSYYQETGRAGRDGLPADCILYFNAADVLKLKRLIEKGEIARVEIQRQLEGLKEVERYCYNDTDCRRQQILRHFDEIFDPSKCHKLCDVCAEGATVVEEDVTKPGLNILRLTKNLIANGENIPKTVIVQVYKGSNAKQVKFKGYETVELYGSGKGIPNDKIDRILDHLFMEEALEKFNVWNREWSNAYVKLGKRADEFLNGKPLVMNVKIDNTNSYQRPSRIGQGSSDRRRSHKPKSKAPTASGSAAKPRSKNTPYIMETEEYEDSLWASPPQAESDDEIETSQTVPKLQPLSKKAKPKSKSEVVVVSSDDDSITACLKDLKEERSEIAKAHGYGDPTELIGDDCLEMLSIVDIKDVSDLRRVLDEFEVDKKIVKLCDLRFVDICLRHKFK